MKALAIVVALLVLSGCGAVASDDLRASTNAYKTCLERNGTEGCAKERAIFETDRDRVAAMGGGVLGIGIAR
jgi:uncharacterized protein YceK